MILELDGLTTEQICKIRTEVDKMKIENNKPKNDIDYENGYCITVGTDGMYGIYRTLVLSDEMVDNIFSIGLYRDTKEECEKLLIKMKIEQRLRQWSKMCKEKVDWNNKTQEKFYLFKNGCHNLLLIDTSYVEKRMNNIYFTDKDILERAINDIGKDILMNDYFCEV